LQAGNLCVRVSPVERSFEEAAAECESDGAALAHVPSQTTQLALMAMIVEKMAKYDFYPSNSEFWLGASVAGDGWAWQESPVPIGEGGYSNWQDSQPGEANITTCFLTSH
jgi:hypothetical protein